MSIKDMTEFEQSLLTDEERSALEAGDAEDAAEATAEALPAGTTDEPVTEIVPEDDAGAADGEPAAEAADGEPAAEGELDADEAPSQRRDSFVMPEGEARDYKAELKALAKKFEDGEITTEEYSEQQSQIITDRAEANVARKVNDAQWSRDVKRFLRDNEQYKSPILYNALQAALEVVNKDTTSQDLDGDQLLEKAHRLVNKEFGQKPPAANTARTRPLPKPGEAEAKAIRSAPKTLADVPAADDAATGSDKYVHLDRLGGIELEQALAKMSEQDADAYLSARS